MILIFYNSLQHHEEYIAPHIVFGNNFEDALLDTEEVDIEGQFESLTAGREILDGR